MSQYSKAIFSSLFPHIAQRNLQVVPIPVRGEDNEVVDNGQFGGLDNPIPNDNPVTQTLDLSPPTELNDNPDIEQPNQSFPSSEEYDTESGVPYDPMNPPKGMTPPFVDPRNEEQTPRPRIVQTDPQSPSVNIQPAVVNQTAQQKVDKWQAQLDNPVNQDKGWKGKARELIQNFLYAMGQSGRLPENNWKTALGSGAIGSALGLINPKWNERREAEQELPLAQAQLERENKQKSQTIEDRYKIAQTQNTLDLPIRAREKMQADVEKQIQGQKNRLEVIARQADIKSGEAKIFTDSEGRQWKQFLKPDSTGKVREMEPIINPTTGEQEFAPGEQMIEVPDPTDSTRTIKVKAKQWLMPGATLANADANRKQDADKFNTTNDIKVAIENANNWQTYNKQVYDLAIASQKAIGGNIENQAELDSYSEKNTSLMNQLAALGGKDKEQMTTSEIEAANKQIDALTKEINDNNVKFTQALGKTQAGREALASLEKQKIVPPTTIKAPRITAVQVTGNKPAAVSEEIFKQRLKANNIPESEWGNRIKQARIDKVIQ